MLNKRVNFTVFNVKFSFSFLFVIKTDVYFISALKRFASLRKLHNILSVGLAAKVSFRRKNWSSFKYWLTQILDIKKIYIKY